MTRSLETETKLELDRQGFEAVLRASTPVNVVAQLNIYFDNSWQLANHNATFRVRLSNSVLVATVKSPLRDGRGPRRMVESEAMLERALLSTRAATFLRDGIDVENDLPVELRDDLLHFGIKHVSCVGWMRNIRRTVRLPASSHIVEVDRAILPDRTVLLELEFEDPQVAAHDDVLRILRQFAPHAKPSVKSKFDRFRQAAWLP